VWSCFTIAGYGLDRLAEPPEHAVPAQSVRIRAGTPSPPLRSRWLSGAVGIYSWIYAAGVCSRGSVSDLLSVRAQLRRVAWEKRKQPLTKAERAALDAALRSTEEALATLADLAGVRYPP